MNAGKEGQRGRIILGGGAGVHVYFLCCPCYWSPSVSAVVVAVGVLYRDGERESWNEMATVQFYASQVTVIHEMNSKLHRPIKLLQRQTEQAS